jgi:hypothetical protein
VLQQGFQDGEKIHPGSATIGEQMHPVLFRVFHVILAKLEYRARLLRVKADAHFALTKSKAQLAPWKHIEKLPRNQDTRIPAPDVATALQNGFIGIEQASLLISDRHHFDKETFHPL